MFSSVNRSIATVLCLVLSCPAFSAPPEAGKPAGLTIDIVQGSRASHSIDTGTGAPTVVRVKDRTGSPVIGAQVTFSVPETGASGVFRGGQRTVTVSTDFEGIATAPPFVPNGETGEFPVQVSASADGVTEKATFSQRNSRGGFDEGYPKPSSRWKWWLGAAAAGATAGVMYLLLRNGGSNSPAWNPGSPTVGGPR